MEWRWRKLNKGSDLEIEYEEQKIKNCRLILMKRLMGKLPGKMAMKNES